MQRHDWVDIPLVVHSNTNSYYTHLPQSIMFSIHLNHNFILPHSKKVHPASCWTWNQVEEFPFFNPLNQCVMHVVHLKNSKTQFLLHSEQCTSIIKLNRLVLMLHKEIIANFSQHYIKCINTFCGQHTQIPNVKSNGTYSGYCALTFNNSTLCPQCALMCFTLLTAWTVITP
jgi:hypothetical protein